MRIKEEFKRSGYFWLPSAREKKLPGTLLISDGGNIELEVIGLFDESINALNSNIALKRIVGRIEKDGLITLDDCSYIRTKLESGGISKSLVYIDRVFSGVEYEESESVFFNILQFSVEGIDEWLEINGFEVDYQDASSSSIITYLQPENITLNLNNGIQLSITFSWQLTADVPNTTEAKIAQKIYFKLVSVEERELNDFISVAYKITTLLCFALDQTVCIEHITATSDNICEDMGEGKTRSVPIKIYFRSIPYSKDEPKITHMLFGYKQIQNDAERIINNWIDAYDEIAPALNLYFATKTGGQKYLEGKFLALAQGLETYHRRTSDDKLMDEVEFKGFVENIVHQCPEEYKDLLVGKLKYGNEISLAKRIKSIIEPFKDLIGTCKERKKIIRSIVDTRNYLTHYDESLKTRAASDQDLFNLCCKVEALFQLHFLQVLEFTPEEIKSIVNDCHLLRWKLKL